MLTRVLRLSIALGLIPACLPAQSPSDFANLMERLDRLEDTNRKLVDEIHELRKAIVEARSETAGGDVASPGGAPPLTERMDVQESRTAQLDQEKVSAAHRLPLSITGMLLFNAFENGHYGSSQYPVIAGLNRNAIVAGASLAQTVLGLTFTGPNLPGGGKATGNVYMDFSGGSGESGDQIVRLRTATLDLQWGRTTVSVGQDKPIIAPREPSSLAQVAVSPLTAAGNLWDWQPQIRIEHRFDFNETTGLRMQGGIYETAEYENKVPGLYLGTLEQARPGYEARFDFFHASGERRFEVAPGFHLSDTHVAGASVPSRVASLDWLLQPHRRFVFTGAWFTGENVAPLGALRQGIQFRSPGNIFPVHSSGGWGQLSLFPIPRLTFNFYGGEQANRKSDLDANSIGSNSAFAGNVVLRLAPNVVAAFETSQTRTHYANGPTRLNNHYDLALGYLF